MCGVAGRLLGIWTTPPRLLYDGAVLLSLPIDVVRDALRADPALRLSARYWTVTLGLDMGSVCYEVSFRDGEVEDVRRTSALSDACDVTYAGPNSAWERLLAAVPEPGYQDLRLLGGPFTETGDQIGHIAPYYAAVQDVVAVFRRLVSGPPPALPAAERAVEFDSAVGRYVYLHVEGVRYRVYFEQAGTGPVPLVLQHTAGADSRQWRHLLEDPDIQRLYTMYAYDLPYHGRSLPPVEVRWWEQEYCLTRDFLLDFVVAFSAAMAVERPVFMGCSIGGHLATDLALYRPDDFRAVIGLNGGLGQRIGRAPVINSMYHPRVASDVKAAMMLSNTAPTSPEAYRREVAWVYSQGAPPVLKGDAHYYTIGHDMTAEEAGRIDTTKVGVYMLTGSYDAFAGPDGTSRFIDAVPGSVYVLADGLGHFGPAEDPAGARRALWPLLERVAASHP